MRAIPSASAGASAVAGPLKIPELPPPAPRPGVAGPEAPHGNVLIARMSQKADLSEEAAMPRGPERKAAVYADLLATATESQAGALARLAELKDSGDVTAVESLFLPNAILVTAAPGRHQAVADALAGVAAVSSVSENRLWEVRGGRHDTAAGAAGATAGAALLTGAQGFVDGRVQEPAVARGAVAAGGAGPAVEWGVRMMRAPEAWARGIDGRGVTIGIIDTGLDAAHPAIAPHYRGTKPDGTQDHQHNWYDAFGRAPVPFDDDGHGTHVAGSSAGGTAERAIGVAPGARLIAAKAINGDGYNATDATLRALQFMLAPTRTDGTAPDPRLGADVVNNSWGTANRSDDTFLDSFAALKAAGIEVVTAAGNDGPGAGTVSPPGSYPGYLSIAATSDSDQVARFSSRGPSKFARPEEMVPNIAAPGARITSAVPGGGYRSMSGTSMAAPHAAGAVALLLQARPQATHDEVVSALEQGAVDVDRPGPDTAAGHGRIDVVAALDRLGADPAAAGRT